MDKEQLKIEIGNCCQEIIKKTKKQEALIEKYKKDFAIPEGSAIRFKRKFPDIEGDKYVAIKINATFKGKIIKATFSIESFNLYYNVYCFDLNDICTVWEQNIKEVNCV